MFGLESSQLKRCAFWQGKCSLDLPLAELLAPCLAQSPAMRVRPRAPELPGLESPAMGSPWASMENPRMSEIMDFNENHYSVRQNGGSTGSSSMRNVFPLHPVTSKRPESPYGATYLFLAENPVFQFFGVLIRIPQWGARPKDLVPTPLDLVPRPPEV